MRPSPAVMPSHSHQIGIRRLEELPSDGGRAVDVLAGANLRIFIRLHEIEEQMKVLISRVAALEVASGSVAKSDSGRTQDRSSSATPGSEV